MFLNIFLQFFTNFNFLSSKLFPFPLGILPFIESFNINYLKWIVYFTCINRRLQDGQNTGNEKKRWQCADVRKNTPFWILVDLDSFHFKMFFLDSFLGKILFFTHFSQMSPPYTWLAKSSNTGNEKECWHHNARTSGKRGNASTWGGNVCFLLS